VSTAAPRPLTPLEVASGLVLERPRGLPRLPAVDPSATPRAALEAAIVPALRRAPCLVSFSGGRDSSAVLAVAAAVARREALPLPVPVTHRFPAAAGTEESDWQELVVRHLGLDDWLRVELSSELDAVGPVAAAVIARHGLLWPCNSYFHDPIFAAAAGGAVLTGIGGDEAFMGSRWDRAAAVLNGRARPVPRDVLRVGFALAPRTVKGRLLRRGLPELFPWLRPAARREVEAWIVADAAAEPLAYRRRLRQLYGSPPLRVGLQGLAALAADHDVRLSHPLHDPRFLATLAARPGEHRARTRSESMEALVGDLLPAEVLRRSTKSHFAEVLWGPASRELAATWEGDGVDPELVDVERLRLMWAERLPETQTITLLQSVWSARARGTEHGNLAIRSGVFTPSPD
jgi:asparagine synthetase B (glutamine-hydrolysing)